VTLSASRTASLVRMIVLDAPSTYHVCLWLQRCQAVFREYYETITSHRRLTWIHSLGQATVS
jgi:hypothetical protein